jgi:hypothetical protein
MTDLKAAASKALKMVAPGEGLHPSEGGNPWAAFDVYIWDQCFSMEQSLRID